MKQETNVVLPQRQSTQPHSYVLPKKTATTQVTTINSKSFRPEVYHEIINWMLNRYGIGKPVRNVELFMKKFTTQTLT